MLLTFSLQHVQSVAKGNHPTVSGAKKAKKMCRFKNIWRYWELETC
jgi:hypothetical protein